MKYKDLNKKEKVIFDRIDNIMLIDEELGKVSIMRIAVLLINKYGGLF